MAQQAANITIVQVNDTRTAVYVDGVLKEKWGREIDPVELLNAVGILAGRILVPAGVFPKELADLDI